MGNLEALGATDAEEEEDGERQNDDRGDDDDAETLLFSALTLLLHLNLIHMEDGIHLSQSLPGFKAIDGVCHLIHTAVKF